ncbi:HAMP domain-containing sensor histidine kinase [Daejeonella oryzae]|uniref:HAMP domain-containing sensor histidine kinase n=1 Tax=Daejeonella oryzae TaxID=1122943 RepID=UPI00041A65BA|nr:ATP-binding protein [Daejeonella oryzae]
MKIKTKLRLGVGLLFGLTLIVCVLATYYLNRLSGDANAVLKDNYESLQYTHNMANVIDNDRLRLDESNIKAFERNLKAQEQNITEAGEAEQTQIIRDQFKQLQNKGSEDAQISQAKLEIKKALGNVNAVNMQAIYDKNKIVLNTVKNANMYLAFIATLCLLIGFTFIVNFPGYIANPIHELTEGIKAIADKNYKQRLEFKSNDEFGDLATAFNTMARKLDEYESSNLSKILFEKSRIEAIIDQMSDAIIGLDEKKQIIFCNPMASLLLGISAQKLIGNYAPDIALHNDLLRNLLTEQPKKELKIYADYKESYFTKDVIEVISNDQVIGRVIVLKNVTGFHELDEAKTNFIATISHELKTPIASIKMSLKLLEDKRIGAINAEQDQLIKHISDDANRLLKITGELLDLAQLETGNIQLNFAAAKPSEIVEYAINAVQFQAEQKSILLELDTDPKLPEVQADVEKTAWVLVNFLSNALRYSAEKSKVIIGVHRKNELVEFSVKDFGSGIEEKYQKRLFERYYQVPTNGRGKFGTGLGLSISKDFIEAQHGEIFVESELGEGSKFGFCLPVTQTE